MLKFTFLLASLKPKIIIHLRKGSWGSNIENKAATPESTVKWLYLKDLEIGVFLMLFTFFPLSPHLFSLEIMKYGVKIEM